MLYDDHRRVTQMTKATLVRHKIRLKMLHWQEYHYIIMDIINCGCQVLKEQTVYWLLHHNLKGCGFEYCWSWKSISSNILWHYLFWAVRRSTKNSIFLTLYAAIYLIDPVGGSIADGLGVGLEIWRWQGQVPVWPPLLLLLCHVSLDSINYPVASWRCCGTCVQRWWGHPGKIAINIRVHYNYNGTPLIH